MPAPARWVMLSFELSRKRHFRRTILGYLKDPTAKVVPSPVLFYIVLYSRSLAAGNHSLCAKLHDNRSGGCKHIVASLLSSSHINHGMFLFFGVCLVAISNGIFFFVLTKNHRLNLFGKYWESVTVCCAIACTAASPPTCVSKVVAIPPYVRALAITFLQLRYPGGSPIAMLVVQW